MNDDETILYAPCGHGACRLDWENLVRVALQDSSTTKVKTGGEGLLDVSKLQCHGCTYVAPIPSNRIISTRNTPRSYSSERMDPFLPLSFIQAVCPSVGNQIALSLCKVSRTALSSAFFHPCTPSKPSIPLSNRLLPMLFAGPRVQVRPRGAACRPVQVRCHHRRQRAGR